LKQDKTEAVMSVSARLDYINKEMCVVVDLGRLPVCVLRADRLHQCADRKADPRHSGEERESQDGGKAAPVLGQKSAWHANIPQIMQIQSAAQQAQEAAA
jgi:hypothetical protein